MRQVINWLCTEGEDHLRRHATIANSLRSIEAQQLQFTKFQSIAQVSFRLCHSFYCIPFYSQLGSAYINDKNRN